MKYIFKKYECECGKEQMKCVDYYQIPVHQTCDCGNEARVKGEVYEGPKPDVAIHQACFVTKSRTFPYYDECLDKVFKSPSDKKRFMKEKGYEQIPPWHRRNQ